AGFRARVRLGPGGVRPGDGESDGVVPGTARLTLLALGRAALYVRFHGPGTACGQGDGGRDRVVAVSAPGPEAEFAAEHTRVTDRDLVVAGAAVRPQVRPGPGGDRAGDAEGQGVATCAAVLVGHQRPGAAGGQGDRGCDRVVAGSAPGVDVEVAVQLAGVVHRDRVDTGAALCHQPQPAPGGDVHACRGSPRVERDLVVACVPRDVERHARRPGQAVAVKVGPQ